MYLFSSIIQCNIYCEMPKGTHLNTWNPGRKSMSHYILSSQMGGNVIMSALLSLRWKLHYREGIDLRFGGYVFSRNNKKKTQSFIFELNSYWHASSFKWIPFSFSVQMLDNCNVSTAGSWVCLFFFFLWMPKPDFCWYIWLGSKSLWSLYTDMFV